ncbi:MAG: hypothetical protein K6E96_09900 [Bacteroidales bacterium]|nr:hypothetical protein [Bacteroidales bacterium]
MKRNKLILSVILCLAFTYYPPIAYSQIKIMNKPNPKQLSTQKYDSLSNFEKMRYGNENPNHRNDKTYHHLIGQTIMYCGSGYKQCFYGEYYTIKSIEKEIYNYLILVSKKTNRIVKVSDLFLEDNFVVQGHYEKLRQKYIGKTIQMYTIIPEMWFELKTGNYAKISKGSTWECIDIQVEDRRGGKSFYRYSPLLMVFENEEQQKIYCYYEAFREHYKVFSKEIKGENINSPKQYEADSLSYLKQLITRFGEEYAPLIARRDIVTGMSIDMCKEILGNPTTEQHQTFLTVNNGEQKKEEIYVLSYKDRALDENGNFSTLVLQFKDNKLILIETK